MDPATILSLANIAIKYGVPAFAHFFRKNSDGTVSPVSIHVILDEAEKRNAESLDLIAKALAEPKA